MNDINMIIARNILTILKKQNKKQVDLADALQTNKQTISKMLNGVRMINAIELKQISDFLGVRMEELTKIPAHIPDTDSYFAFVCATSQIKRLPTAPIPAVPAKWTTAAATEMLKYCKYTPSDFAERILPACGHRASRLQPQSEQTTDIFRYSKTERTTVPATAPAAAPTVL